MRSMYISAEAYSTSHLVASRGIHLLYSFQFKSSTTIRGIEGSRAGSALDTGFLCHIHLVHFYLHHIAPF